MPCRRALTPGKRTDELSLADGFVDCARFGRRLGLEPGERLAAAVERFQGLGAALLALIAEHQAAVEAFGERIGLEAALVAGERPVEFAALLPESADVSHGAHEAAAVALARLQLPRLVLAGEESAAVKREQLLAVALHLRGLERGARQPETRIDIVHELLEI